MSPALNDLAKPMHSLRIATHGFVRRHQALRYGHAGFAHGAVDFTWPRRSFESVGEQKAFERDAVGPNALERSVLCCFCRSAHMFPLFAPSFRASKASWFPFGGSRGHLALLFTLVWALFQSPGACASRNSNLEQGHGVHFGRTPGFGVGRSSAIGCRNH